MNKVILIGNLTRDPELTETPSGVAVCKFSIAVSRNYTDADGNRETDFFNCVAWRGLGETIARYTKKGNKVMVDGSIQLRNYEDNNGVKRTAVDIVVQACEFLTSKASEEKSGDKPTGKRPTLQAMDDDTEIPF